MLGAQLGCGVGKAGVFAGSWSRQGERGSSSSRASVSSYFLRRYWANLKLWFKQKISKEEFDLEAHRLLTQDNGKIKFWGELVYCFQVFLDFQ